MQMCRRTVHLRHILGDLRKRHKSADVNTDGKVDEKDASSILTYYVLVSTSSGDIPTMKEFMAPKKA